MAIPAKMQGDGGMYVDDNFFTVHGSDFAECNTKINSMLDMQEDCMLNWQNLNVST